MGTKYEADWAGYIKWLLVKERNQDTHTDPPSQENEDFGVLSDSS